MDIFKANQSFEFFKKYIANPFLAIKSVPNWNLTEILFFQLSISAVLGLAASIFSKTYFNLIFFPISSLMITFVGATLFYLLFSALFSRDFDFYKIYMIVFLSHLPFLFLRIFKFWATPVEIIGFAATSILLTVGFVENFYLPKRKLIIIFGSIFTIYFTTWMANQIYTQKATLDIKRKLQHDEFKTEDSIERIKRELSQ